MTPDAIQVFAMHGDRIAEHGESVDYYDILVRADGDDGEIHEIEEHEDLTEEQANKLVAELEVKYNMCAEWVGGSHFL